MLSLATVLDPDGRLAALPPDRRNQIISDKLELIAASPQNELLPSFWNAETGDSRVMIRMLEQQPAPDKNKIFRIATLAAAERFGQWRLARALLAERVAVRPTPLTKAQYEKAARRAAQ